MAKKKIQQDSFIEMRKRIQKTPITKAKPVEVTALRKYFLIVCEGEKTEPAYFEYIQRMLPKHLLTTIDIRGEGDNTINIVKKAVALRDARKKTDHPYDEVWAVYDKDDFPASRYNEAVKYSMQHDIQSAHSNQSFELWYILHFKNLQSAWHRSRCIEALSKEILKTPYAKNDPHIPAYMFKHGKVKRAIKWAKALDEKYKGPKYTPATSCPHTMVYALVEKLLKYCNPELISPAQSNPTP